MPHQQAKILIYIDLSRPLTTAPPGQGEPGYECALVEARMLMEAAYAGASKRVLIKLTRKLDPLTREIARWMVRETKAARLTSDLNDLTDRMSRHG